MAGYMLCDSSQRYKAPNTSCWRGKNYLHIGLRLLLETAQQTPVAAGWHEHVWSKQHHTAQAAHLEQEFSQHNTYKSKLTSTSPSIKCVLASEEGNIATLTDWQLKWLR